jgi:hypothetical protein
LLKAMACDDGRLLSMSERAWQSRDSLALSNQGGGDRLMSIYQDASHAAVQPFGSAAVHGA